MGQDDSGYPSSRVSKASGIHICPNPLERGPAAANPMSQWRRQKALSKCVQSTLYISEALRMDLQQSDLKIRGGKALAMRKGGSTIALLTSRLPGPSASQPPGEGRVELITKGRRSLYKIFQTRGAISHPLSSCTLIP